jgi:hypothetical protein
MLSHDGIRTLATTSEGNQVRVERDGVVYLSCVVTPAKAGAQIASRQEVHLDTEGAEFMDVPRLETGPRSKVHWVPAFAGMT